MEKWKSNTSTFDFTYYFLSPAKGDWSEFELLSFKSVKSSGNVNMPWGVVSLSLGQGISAWVKSCYKLSNIYTSKEKNIAKRSG